MSPTPLEFQSTNDRLLREESQHKEGSDLDDEEQLLAATLPSLPTPAPSSHPQNSAPVGYFFQCWIDNILIFL